MKLLKRGYKNLLIDPSIIYDKKKQNIKLHFDMHHGYGNIDKAINVLNQKDRNDFREFVSENYSFNPHIMFITKKEIMRILLLRKIGISHINLPLHCIKEFVICFQSDFIMRFRCVPDAFLCFSYAFPMRF